MIQDDEEGKMHDGDTLPRQSRDLTAQSAAGARRTTPASG